MLPVLQQADLFLINLETTLTSQTRPADPDKVFNFRAEPTAAEAPKTGGVDFACVANNHILDFGTEGLKETLAILDGAGIAHAGAGPDLESAQRHVILTADGLRVAIVAGLAPPDLLLQFIRDADFDCFIPPNRYTLTEQTAIDEFLPMCQERNFSGCTSVEVRLISAIRWR